MINLLFLGRHLLNTAFQERYLKEILTKEISELNLYNSRKFKEKKIKKLVFAITSANQDNSRYNPLSIKERILGVERFSQQLKMVSDFEYCIFGIPHYNQVKNFPELINKEIEAETDGSLKINPENTIVFCSTPCLIQEYKKMGFSILTGEYDMNKKEYFEKTPTVILSEIFNEYGDLKKYREKLNLLSFANIGLWKDFPYIPNKIAWIWTDPLLTEMGGLTETRDYSTYSFAMSNPEAIRFKYNEIKDSICEGKIVDEGCADGALLNLISKDFFDSDLIGIEITSEFLAMCKERLRRGEFGENFVHFYQRNLMNKIFEDNSINTTICNSTAHEIYSYGGGKNSLVGYLKKKYAQLRKGGRLIIRDVVGPEKADKFIYLSSNKSDGKNEIKSTKKMKNFELVSYLGDLSTHSRFFVFVNDFIPRKIKYSLEKIGEEDYIKLKLRDACEFLSKKDYVDNWRSELHEEFAFWSYSDWKNELEKIGFNLLEDEGKSGAYVNEWIVENRLKGKAALFEKENKELKKINYPVNNVLLVAEK